MVVASSAQIPWGHGGGRDNILIASTGIRELQIMSQTISSATPTVTVDYDATLIMAVETSSKSWVVAAHVPGLGHLKAKQTIATESKTQADAMSGVLAALQSAIQIVQQAAASATLAPAADSMFLEAQNMVLGGEPPQIPTMPQAPQQPGIPPSAQQGPPMAPPM